MDTLLGSFEQLAATLAFPDCVRKEFFCDKKGRAAHAMLYFKDFKVDFVFMKSGAAFELRNVLSLHILPKEDLPVYLFFSEALLHICPGRYINYNYFYIASNEQLKDCFEELKEGFSLALPGLLSYMEHPAKRKELFEGRLEEINRFIKTPCFFVDENGCCMKNEQEGEADDGYIDSMTELFYRSKYTFYFTPPFSYFFEGKNRKALEKLARTSKKDAEAGEISRLPEHRIIFTTLQKELFALAKKGNRIADIPKIFAALLLMFLIILLPASLLYGGIFLFFAGSFDSATLYTTSLVSLPSLFPVIFVAAAAWLLCFDRRLLYRLLYSKKLREAYRAMDSFDEKPFLRVLGALILSGTVAWSAFLGGQTIRFEQNRLADGRKFFSLKETYYLYDQIERAAWVGSGVAGENPSHDALYLKLSDGVIINLSELAGSEAVKARILPILSEHGIDVERCDGYKEFENAKRGEHETV